MVRCCPCDVSGCCTGANSGGVASCTQGSAHEVDRVRYSKYLRLRVNYRQDVGVDEFGGSRSEAQATRPSPSCHPGSPLQPADPTRRQSGDGNGSFPLRRYRVTLVVERCDAIICTNRSCRRQYTTLRARRKSTSQSAPRAQALFCYPSPRSGARYSHRAGASRPP
jgi:hypothetical protein